MTLNDFIENAADLTDEAFKKKLATIFQIILESDVEVLREQVEDGFLDSFTDLEADDFFGTEGMSL